MAEAAEPRPPCCLLRGAVPCPAVAPAAAELSPPAPAAAATAGLRQAAAPQSRLGQASALQTSGADALMSTRHSAKSTSAATRAPFPDIFLQSQQLTWHDWLLYGCLWARPHEVSQHVQPPCRRSSRRRCWHTQVGECRHGIQRRCRRGRCWRGGTAANVQQHVQPPGRRSSSDRLPQQVVLRGRLGRGGRAAGSSGAAGACGAGRASAKEGGCQALLLGIHWWRRWRGRWCRGVCTRRGTWRCRSCREEARRGQRVGARRGEDPTARY